MFFGGFPRVFSKKQGKEGQGNNTFHMGKKGPPPLPRCSSDRTWDHKRIDEIDRQPVAANRDEDRGSMLTREDSRTCLDKTCMVYLVCKGGPVGG